MKDRVTGMLGLCARAGRLITGEKAVIQAIRAGNCFLAVLDGDAAENARDSLGRACRTHGVPMITISAAELGKAIGRPGRMAAGVTDAGMAKRLIEMDAMLEAKSFDRPDD